MACYIQSRLDTSRLRMMNAHNMCIVINRFNDHSFAACTMHTFQYATSDNSDNTVGKEKLFRHKKSS
jgi:hypothetical protein